MSRVGIISCDYAGTLANYFDLANDRGIASFHTDMKNFKNLLFVVKSLEKLDKIYFSLNTMESRIPTLQTALQGIFQGEDWLEPGPQFIAGFVFDYNVNTKTLSENKQTDKGYQPSNKLGNLSLFALNKSKENQVVSVTHIEDGVDYSNSELDLLTDVGIATHIINLPLNSNRLEMIDKFQENITTRAATEHNNHRRVS